MAIESRRRGEPDGHVDGEHTWHGRNWRSIVQHGSEGFSRAAQAQVNGTAELPEEVVFDLCVYQREIGGRCAVKCAVDIDVANVKFSLVPLADEVQRAVYDTRKEIVEMLRAALQKDEATRVVTVLLGSP